MAQPLIVVLSVTIACVAVFALSRGLRQARGSWSATSTFVFLISCGLIWTTVLGSLTGAASYTTDFFYNRVAVSEPWLDRLREVTSFVMVVASALFVVRGIRRRIPINGAAFFYAGVVVFGQVATGLSGDGMFSPRTLALLSIVVACAFAERGTAALLGVAAFGTTIAVVSTLMPVFSYEASVSECGDKCGALGFVFAGALVNGNALGLVLALALPAVYLAFTGAPRWILIGVITVIVAVSASRTSLNAVIVLIVVLLLARPGIDARMSLARKSVVIVAVSIATIASIVLPFVTSDPSAYTGRGYLWHLAFERMAGHDFVGLGSQAWGEMTQVGQIAQTAGYSAHNQWLDIWFIAGWSGIVLFVCFLAAVFRQAGRDAYLPALVALPAAIIGITERPWAVGTIDTFTFAIFAFLLAAPVRPSSSDRFNRSGIVLLARSPEVARRSSPLIDPSGAQDTH